MIRVLVVDDSAFMRKALTIMLEKDPEIKVIATAANGEEALDKVAALDPDVITLDVEMPVMDGLTTLRHIMMENPKPVLMVSSLTQEGAEATLEALELGAVDYIPKKLSRVSLEIVKIEEELCQKVKLIARSGRLFSKRPRRKKTVPVPKKVTSPASVRHFRRELVGVGVSTGGPPAVQRIISAFPVDFPGVLFIAQHMPATFTPAFAKRLNELCVLEVKEAEDGERVEKGVAYVAPGGRHLKLEKKGSSIYTHISSFPVDSLYKPSVDQLFFSLARTGGENSLGVVLTGMGHDGLEGSKLLKVKGGRILAQSEESCVIYGMPKAVIEAGLADQVVSLEGMARAIVENLCL